MDGDDRASRARGVRDASSRHADKVAADGAPHTPGGGARACAQSRDTNVPSTPPHSTRADVAAGVVTPGPLGGGGSALAAGWVPVKDPDSGDTYYWNQLTNETTWDKPLAAEPPAPSVQPQAHRGSRAGSAAHGAAAATAAARARRSSGGGSFSGGAAQPPTPSGGTQPHEGTGALAVPPPVTVVHSSGGESEGAHSAAHGSEMTSPGSHKSLTVLGDRWLLSSVGAEAYIDDSTGQLELRSSPSSRVGSVPSSRVGSVPSSRVGSAPGSPQRERRPGARPAARGGSPAAGSRRASAHAALADGSTARSLACAMASLSPGASASAAQAAAEAGHAGSKLESGRTRLLVAGTRDSAAAEGEAARARRRDRAQAPAAADGAPKSGRRRMLCCYAAAILAGVLLVAIVVALSGSRRRPHGGGDGGDGGDSGPRPFSPAAPRPLYAGRDVVELDWSDAPPEGAFAAGSEVQLLRGGPDGAPLATYAGLRTRVELGGLPAQTALCARVRLQLRAEVTGAPLGGELSRWSECAAVRTGGASAPRPPALVPRDTGVSWVEVQWAPPHANGAEVSGYQLEHSSYALQTVRACEQTGPSCALGCAQLGRANWTEEGTRLAPMWEHCKGANLVGCCGPFCWCYDRRCCAPRTELAEVPFASARELPAARSEPLAWARVSAGPEGPGHSYSVRARARNAYGYSEWSAPLTLPTNAQNATAPAAVRGLLFRAAPTALRLQWQPARTRGAPLLGYELRVVEARSGVDELPAHEGVVRAVPPSRSTHVLEGLLPASVYTVAVRARNAHGAGEWSAPVAAVTRELRPPRAPVDLVIEQRYADGLGVAWPRAIEETSSVVGYELHWARLGAEEGGGEWAAGCRVERRADGAEPAESDAPTAGPAVPGDVEHPRCTLSGLPPHASVALRARARSLAGWGPLGPAVPALTRAVSACGAVGDQRAIFATPFADQLQTCSSQCWGQPPCTQHCLQGLELSEPCAQCFATAVACSKSTCRSSCSWDSRAAACHACTAEQCLPALSQCAGADTPMGVL